MKNTTAINPKPRQGSLKTLEEIDARLPIYTEWNAIPLHLYRKSDIERKGLKLSKGQPAAAYFQNAHEKYYTLYDVNLCVSKKGDK